MDLIARIERALAEPGLDPGDFERCAVALLQRVYPGLSAVEGGHDFGRDADIYFPLDTAAAGLPRRGRLLATTGDVRANVAQGLVRMREEGLSVDLLVVATSRPLSATQRRSIEQLAADHGVGDVQFYTRDWFVGRLLKEPVWRQRLLNIGGQLGALVARPISLLQQSSPGAELVGRQDVLRSLRELIEQGRDLALVGPPGVGKTRVCAELGAGVLFVEPADEGRLLDDLREMEPRVVVVDDAHDRARELTVLQRARAEEGLRFVIVAVTWSDQTRAVEGAVPGATSVVLPLLARAEIDTLIQAEGVRGHRARTLVLEQAQGRPGWALMLSAALLRGDADEVLSGAALLTQVQGFVQRNVPSPVALDILACLATLTSLTDDDVPQLAGLVGHPLAEVSDLLRRSATNGLLDRVPGGWTLQPTLAAPLIASWFFGDLPMRPWSTLQAAFPSRGGDLMRAVIAAATTGTPGALRAADQWATTLPDPRGWDIATWTVVHAYSALDAGRAAWAVTAARQVLAAPRSNQTSLFDPLGDAARRQLVDAARRHLLPEAITGLLDLAVGDDRPRGQNSDHPLRVLADLAVLVDPDFGTSVELRRGILRSTLGWLRREETGQRWVVAAEVLAAVFSPRVSGSWTDPAAPMTLTLTHGIERSALLAELTDSWTAEVMPALTAAVVGQIPPAGLQQLLDVAEEWLRIGARRVPESDRVSDGQAAVAGAGGTLILSTLRPHLAAVPGLALRVDRVLAETDRADIEGFDLDRQLIALVGGERGQRGDRESFFAKRREQIGVLAAELLAMGADAGVRRFSELAEQSELSRGPDLLPWLAGFIVDAADDLAAWCQAAVGLGCRPVLGTALARMVTDPAVPDPPLGLVRAALADPRLRNVAMTAVLAATQLTPATDTVLDDLTDADSWLLDQTLARRHGTDLVLWRLLTHPVASIRSTTALYFAVGTDHGPPLPVDWSGQWRRVVLAMNAEELGQHDEWRVGELLRHLARTDPDLFEQWYTNRITEMRAGYLRAPPPRGSEMLLALLPAAHRGRLARLCGGRPRIGPSLLTHLIGVDVNLAAALLDDGSLTPQDLLESLLGQRGPILEALAPVLYDRGVPAADLAAAASGYVGWVGGSESGAHHAVLNYFEHLLAHDNQALRAVAEAGVRQQRNHLAAVLAKEREGRVHGYL